MAGEKKNAISALLLSLLALIITFQQNYHNNQLLIKPNETVGLYFCRDYLQNEPPPFCLLCSWYKDLSSEGSLHGARIFSLHHVRLS